MQIKFVNKKYLPVYFLASGVFVFIFAFYYASNKSPTTVGETANNDNQLNTAGNDSTDKIVPEVANPETPTEQITSTLKPTKAVSTLTITPTISHTPTPSISPTTTVTSVPSPSASVTSTDVTPTDSVTATLTPTP